MGAEVRAEARALGEQPYTALRESLASSILRSWLEQWCS
jgi:hypothetical protein